MGLSCMPHDQGAPTGHKGFEETRQEVGSSWQGVKCHSPVPRPDEAVLHTSLAAQDMIVEAYHM